MTESVPEKILASVSIDLADQEARIEKLHAGEAGQVTLRISVGSKGGNLTGPLTLSEGQLIELLHKAIHNGVISNGFIGKLREKIEI
jgi:hypothetical protein